MCFSQPHCITDLKFGYFSSDSNMYLAFVYLNQSFLPRFLITVLTFDIIGLASIRYTI